VNSGEGRGELWCWYTVLWGKGIRGQMFSLPTANRFGPLVWLKSQKRCEVGTTLDTILQMRKLRPGEVRDMPELT
jgi:hypothetical protein